MSLTRKHKYDIPYVAAVVISCVLIALNLIRIFKVPVTIDELGYDPGDSYASLVEITHGSPNNHILHSIIRKFLVEHFSTDLFFYRVDSLVAQLVFLMFSFRISRLLFANKWWALMGFCMLNITAPLIFDFWGLSRGYALALTFMMVSVYYLLRYVADFRFGHLCLSLGMAMLAAYSNFGYLNYFLTLGALIILHSVIFRPGGWQKRLIKEAAALGIATALLVAVVFVPFRNIYNNGQNVFLGQHGFIEDTVTSLVRDGLFLSGDSQKNLINALIWLVVGSALLCGVYWIYILFKGRYYRNAAAIETRWGILLYLLLMITVVSLVAQHLFFNINYLTDRTALFFIIFFILQLVYLLYYVRPVVPQVSWTALVLLFLAVGYNFVSKANTNATHMWWFNADDMNVLKMMAGEEANKQEKIKVGLNWMVTGTIHFDAERFYPGRFQVAEVRDNIGADTTMDYYYVAGSDVTDKLREHYQQKASFVGGGFVLFKKK